MFSLQGFLSWISLSFLSAVSGTALSMTVTDSVHLWLSAVLDGSCIKPGGVVGGGGYRQNMLQTSWCYFVAACKDLKLSQPPHQIYHQLICCIKLFFIEHNIPLSMPNVCIQYSKCGKHSLFLLTLLAYDIIQWVDPFVIKKEYGIYCTVYICIVTNHWQCTQKIA